MIQTNKKRTRKVNQPANMFFMLLFMAALTGCSTNVPSNGANIPETSAQMQQSPSPDGAASLSPEGLEDAAASGDNLIIPITEISEKATFYPVEIDGTELEVLAVKAPDGTIRTAFNTCEVCYDSGRGYYKQDGDVLVCQNCGNRFKTSQIEVQSRGCNPWPIFAENKTVDDKNITISYDFLNESAVIFQNWKGNY